MWYRVQWGKKTEVFKDTEGYNDYKENSWFKSPFNKIEGKKKKKEEIFNREDDFRSL